jgi:hypothetical protein
VPRKNNRRDDAPALDLEKVQRGAAWVVTAGDGTWRVRTITAAGAVKIYRCPGCDHQIAVGVPHVVVWPEASGEGLVADRRHWHTACWNSHTRRSQR